MKIARFRQSRNLLRYSSNIKLRLRAKLAELSEDSDKLPFKLKKLVFKKMRVKRLTVVR